MNHINEAELNETERLGLAWCRLNNRIWDPLLGEEPIGFNENPEAYTFPALKAIEAIIGEASCNWFWWRFFLGKSRAEWLSWWLTKDFPKMLLEPEPKSISVRIDANILHNAIHRELGSSEKGVKHEHR